MEFYADVLSGGVKQGSGPLTAIAGCTVTRRVDAAGSWALRVAAADPQASQLTIRRSVKIYAYVDDAYAAVGGGIIDSVTRQVEPDGSEWLIVAGADQLRELANLSTVQLLLADDSILGGWTANASLNGWTSIQALTMVGGADRDIVLAGIEDTTYGEVIVRSVDKGNTWTPVMAGGSTGGYGIYAFADLGGGIVLAAGTASVYRSEDYGSTWTAVGGVITAYSVVRLSTTDDAAFGTSTGTVYLSADNGATWDAGTSAGIGSQPIHDLLDVGGGIYLAASSGNDIARSTDSGGSWGGISFSGSWGTTAYCLLEPASGVILAGTNTGYIIQSTDSGATWSAGTSVAGGAAIRWLIMWGAYVVAAAGGKVYVGSSGDSWATFAFTECGDLGAATATYALTGLTDSVLAGANNGALLWRGSTIQVGVTHAAAVQALEDLASGWTFTADASPANDNILIQFAGESVLTAALMVAERSGTHCYLSGDQALTFADTWTDSGIHATNGLRGNGNLSATVAALIDLTVEQSSYDLVTRVYPFGKRADGATLIGIGAATVADADGYTIDEAAGYVQHTAAVAAYGVIERMVTFPEIVLPATPDVLLPVFDSAPTAEEEVGNALVRAAKTYLSKTVAPVTNYKLKLAGLSALLWPLDSIRVDYIGDTIVSGELYIMAATWTGDGNGLVTSDLVAATATVLIETDVQLLARAVQRIDAVAAR